MSSQTFRPSAKYRTRLWAVMTITALSIFAGGALIALLMCLDPEARSAAAVLLLITAALDVAWYLPALAVAAPYHRSLRYEIQEDEVIVYAGIWTHSVKHVPYRTVTNLKVKRDVLDRLLGIGTLNIQTAGMGSTNAPEESLVGLDDVQAVYEIVAAELRRFRGGMAPTAAEEEAPAATMEALLAEVRAIRQALATRQSPN